MDQSSLSDSPFLWGLATGFGLGAIFCCMSLIAHWKTKRELKRYQQHLSDKLEIEAEQFSALKKASENLKTENENLRLKIGAGKTSDSIETLDRELEIYARAERRMVVHAPGFAGAWETAKAAAHEEIQAEERGKSLPRRIFKKFFPGSTGHDDKSSAARITTTRTIETDPPEEDDDHHSETDTVVEQADSK